MRGRKPSLQVIDGGNVPGRSPAAPAWLPDHAKAEWRRVVPEMQRRKLLSADMLATLESYCIATGTIRECEETMARDGRIISGEDGPKPHPAVRIQNAAMREARLLAAELGITPHRRHINGGGDDAGKGGGWDDLLA
jgi:P27 family predicted phage terminase small subunit